MKQLVKISASARIEEVFWSMVKAGSLVTDADVLPTEAPLLPLFRLISPFHSYFAFFFPSNTPVTGRHRQTIRCLFNPDPTVNSLCQRMLVARQVHSVARRKKRQAEARPREVSGIFVTVNNLLLNTIKHY